MGMEMVNIAIGGRDIDKICIAFSYEVAMVSKISNKQR